MNLFLPAAGASSKIAKRSVNTPTRLRNACAYGRYRVEETARRRQVEKKRRRGGARTLTERNSRNQTTGAISLLASPSVVHILVVRVTNAPPGPFAAVLLKGRAVSHEKRLRAG